MAVDFWNFSLKVYAAQGVPDECLSLQDGYGVDVNLVLFAAYMGSMGHMLSRREIDEVQLKVRDWQEQVIKPLRSARRAIKQMLDTPSREKPEHVDAFYATTKKNELEAEKLEQDCLNDWAKDRPPQQTSSSIEAAVRTNTRLFLNACNAGSAPTPERLIAAALAL